MVKIKVEKNMNLLELIDWAWKNGVKEKAFYSNIDGGSLYFDMAQTVSIEHLITKDETFTVEVEEELTENTVLPSVVVVRTQYFPNNGHSVNVAKINSKSIKQVIENQPNNSKFEYHSIYLMESERIGQLIWKDGELVGDE